MTWRCALVVLMVLAQPGFGQEFTTLKGHGGPIMDIAVADNGTVVSASFDNSIGIWAPDGPTWAEGHDAAVNIVLPEDGGNIFSGGDDFSVRRWAEAEGRVLWRHKGKVVDLDVSENGRLASASWDGTIGLATGEDVTFLSGHRAGVNAVAFDTAAEQLFSASSDGTIRVWDVQAGSEIRQLVKHGFGINRIILNSADNWLAYGAVDGGTRVVDPDNGDEIADFTLDRRPILAMDYHRATGQLAVGDGQGYIMIVDTNAWRIARDFRAARAGPVWALAFSPDGKTLYAGGIDDVVFAWPVDLLDAFEPEMGQPRSFLREADSMPNGERQFMRKCSICHALTAGPSRKAGPTLHGVFGRQAGTVDGYRYSSILNGSDIIWSDETIDALFDLGPDHYIPGSKMPMQVIAGAQDRADLIGFLKQATRQE